jgi:hypothetical protein
MSGKITSMTDLARSAVKVRASRRSNRFNSRRLRGVRGIGERESAGTYKSKRSEAGGSETASSLTDSMKSTASAIESRMFPFG